MLVQSEEECVAIRKIVSDAFADTYLLLTADQQLIELREEQKKKKQEKDKEAEETSKEKGKGKVVKEKVKDEKSKEPDKKEGTKGKKGDVAVDLPVTFEEQQVPVDPESLNPFKKSTVSDAAYLGTLLSDSFNKYVNYKINFLLSFCFMVLVLL